MFVATAQGKDGCCHGVRQSLDIISTEIEALRAKLGKQCQHDL